MGASSKRRFDNRFRVSAAPVLLLFGATSAWAQSALNGRVPHQSGLVELYLTGGVFMHPILLCSVIGLGIILERLYFFAKARTNTQKLMGDLLRILQDQG